MPTGDHEGGENGAGGAEIATIASRGHGSGMNGSASGSPYTVTADQRFGTWSQNSGSGSSITMATVTNLRRPGSDHHAVQVFGLGGAAGLADHVISAGRHNVSPMRGGTDEPTLITSPDQNTIGRRPRTVLAEAYGDHFAAVREWQAEIQAQRHDLGDSLDLLEMYRDLGIQNPNDTRIQASGEIAFAQPRPASNGVKWAHDIDLEPLYELFNEDSNEHSAVLQQRTGQPVATFTATPLEPANVIVSQSQTRGFWPEQPITAQPTRRSAASIHSGLGKVYPENASDWPSQRNCSVDSNMSTEPMFLSAFARAPLPALKRPLSMPLPATRYEPKTRKMESEDDVVRDHVEVMRDLFPSCTEEELEMEWHSAAMRDAQSRPMESLPTPGYSAAGGQQLANPIAFPPTEVSASYVMANQTWPEGAHAQPQVAPLGMHVQSTPSRALPATIITTPRATHVQTTSSRPTYAPTAPGASIQDLQRVAAPASATATNWAPTPQQQQPHFRPIASSSAPVTSTNWASQQSQLLKQMSYPIPNATSASTAMDYRFGSLDAPSLPRDQVPSGCREILRLPSNSGSTNHQGAGKRSSRTGRKGTSKVRSCVFCRADHAKCDGSWRCCANNHLTRDLEACQNHGSAAGLNSHNI